MSEQKAALKLIHMEDVQTREVQWLWYPYIAYGKITVIEGDPGEGKTTLALTLAALLSRGQPLPCDEDIPYEPISIIYQTAEDGIDDTIKPRLEKANADCSKIRVIDETEKELSMTDERLEQAIAETNAKLVILDPIQAYIGSDVDMHRANEIRPVLKRLGIIAEKYGCAILLIGHMNKASGSKSTYRGLGSIDIQATARSVLLVARIPDKPNIRIMAQDKSSLAAAGDSIGFEISEDRGFECIGPYDITVDELLAGKEGRGRKKLDVAIAFIKEYFGAESEVSSKDIEEEAAKKGIKRNTLLSAKKKLGIMAGNRKTTDGTMYWTWILPKKEFNNLTS
jgi:energy-coupling factor transporter ATP-binding protein EcfA2